MSARGGTVGVFDEIAILFAAHGHETYGEGVTMAEHSLQTAALARAEAADEALVAAALLHDIGHFIETPDDAFGHHKHDRSGGVRHHAAGGLEADRGAGNHGNLSPRRIPAVAGDRLGGAFKDL